MRHLRLLCTTLEKRWQNLVRANFAALLKERTKKNQKLLRN
jgi:hypothetical protein